MAEVQRVVQFLQNDELCALLGQLGNAVGQSVHVVLYVGCVVLLYYSCSKHFFFVVVLWVIGNNALRKLHGKAVQRPVLFDNGACVYAYNFAVWVSLGDGL